MWGSDPLLVVVYCSKGSMVLSRVLSPVPAWVCLRTHIQMSTASSTIITAAIHMIMVVSIELDVTSLETSTPRYTGNVWVPSSVWVPQPYPPREQGFVYVQTPFARCRSSPSSHVAPRGQTVSPLLAHRPFNTPSLTISHGHSNKQWKSPSR